MPASLRYQRAVLEHGDLEEMNQILPEDTRSMTESERGFATLATNASPDVVSFSAREEQILALHAQLEELNLEVAISERLCDEPAGDLCIRSSFSEPNVDNNR